MSALDDVIRRLEAGESGREVDAAIWWHVDRARAEGTYWAAALGLPRPLTKMPDGGLGWANMRVCAPHYTTSLDAAVSLVPEGWTVAQIGQGDNKRWWVELRHGFQTSYGKVVIAPTRDGCATPALALCIAALKARGRSTLPRPTERV